MNVMCISSLGCSFPGVVVDDNLDLGDDIHKEYLTVYPDDKFALVYDLEYDVVSVQKWGVDCFTEEEYIKRNRV